MRDGVGRACWLVGAGQEFLAAKDRTVTGPVLEMGHCKYALCQLWPRSLVVSNKPDVNNKLANTQARTSTTAGLSTSEWSPEQFCS
jgi:hypothetical protein